MSKEWSTKAMDVRASRHERLAAELRGMIAIANSGLFRNREIAIHDRVHAFLSTTPTRAYPVGFIHEVLGEKDDSVRQALSKLKKEGRVENPQHGQWRARL